MSKNILNKLEKKIGSNLKVEPIFKDENKSFLLINFLKKQRYLNSNEVLEILKINFDHEKPIGYALIKEQKEIVGFLGTIFSKRHINDKIIEHCYLHSWIVLEQHRLEAFKLILPIIKKKIFISTFSPIKTLEGLYKKLGFEEINFFSTFAFTLSFLSVKKNNITLNEEKSFFEKYLLSNEKILLNDHISTNTKKIFIYFNENINDNIFLIVKKKTKKFLFPVLEIIYVSNLDKFKQHQEIIGSQLLKRFKTIFFKISSLENEIFSKNIFFKKNIKKKAYFLNKPSNFKFNVLYSEFLR